MTKQLDKAAKSLNVGRDDLYVVTDVPQLQYELEVCQCTAYVQCVQKKKRPKCFW